MRAMDSALEAALRWAITTSGVERVTLLTRAPLTGGVSGAAVERLTIGLDDHGARTVSVVIKRADRQEIDALTLLAQLGEPAIPSLLASGSATDGPWIVLPWIDGEPLGLMDEAPATVGALMARVHSRFAGRTALWPGSLERVDDAFVHRALTEFVPATLERLPDGRATGALRERASTAADSLQRDPSFRRIGASLPSTVLHGDLYGLNVVRDHSGSVSLIDWNAARIGPGMFDIAMSATGPDSELVLAYRTELDRIGAPPRPVRLEFDWCCALIRTMYAGVVAARDTVTAAHGMLDAAAAARARLATVRT